MAVTIDEALMYKSKAFELLRSGNATAEERGQLTEKWGSDFVVKAMTLDSNEYEIDDVSYDAAKNAGRKAASEKTGHDGSKRGWVGTATTAVGAAGVAVAATVGTKFVGCAVKKGLNLVSKNLGYKATATAGQGSKNLGTKNLGAYATVILAAAIAAKYWAGQPNKAEYNAAMQLMQEEFPEAQASLYDAQNNAADATACIEELTAEAEDTNEEAGEEVEKNKALFDFYRDQFTAIIEKVNSGEPLTPDEKALMEQLMPLLEELGITIEEIQEDTTGTVEDLYDEVGDYQGAYDEVGEAIAEVEGMTDFVASFDEATKTNTTIEGISQGVNAAGATRAAIQLSAGGFWNWAFAAIGYAAAASSGLASAQQVSWSTQLGAEVEARQAVQDLGAESTDIYNENLDIFAGNMEVIEDLELEMPEDMEVPEAPAVQDDGTTLDPLAAAAAGVENDDNKNDPYSPLGSGNGSGGVNGNGGTNGNNPNKKPKEDEE